MVIRVESKEIGFGKQLTLDANADKRHVSYRVAWSTDGTYHVKEFAEGHFAEAVDFYESIVVSGQKGENK